MYYNPTTTMDIVLFCRVQHETYGSSITIPLRHCAFNFLSKTGTIAGHGRVKK